jgi:hypothetical protein
MTQEEKDLLLKVLCEQLPYGVTAEILYKDIMLIPDGSESDSDFESDIVDLTIKDHDAIMDFANEDWLYKIKPYLRPMESMTEEEKKEYELLANHCIVTSIGFIHFEIQELIDWLNAHHFDYRGLIPKGLAIAVTEENNPYKTK